MPVRRLVSSLINPAEWPALSWNNRPLILRDRLFNWISSVAFLDAVMLRTYSELLPTVDVTDKGAQVQCRNTTRWSIPIGSAGWRSMKMNA